MEESSSTTTKKETQQQQQQKTPPPISYSPCLFIQHLRAAYLKCLGMEDTTKEVLEETRSPDTAKTDDKEAKPDTRVPGATPVATTTTENDPSPGEGSVPLPVSETAGPTASDPDGSSAIDAGSVAADPVVDDLPADASVDPSASTTILLSIPLGSSVSTGSGSQHH